MQTLVLLANESSSLSQFLAGIFCLSSVTLVGIVLKKKYF